MDKLNNPYHVWRRNDGYLGWTKGAVPPQEWTGVNGSEWSFETLLSTHDAVEARERLMAEREKSKVI